MTIILINDVIFHTMDKLLLLCSSNNGVVPMIMDNFGPKIVTFNGPTLVMNCKKSLLFFYFSNSFLHIVLPKGDFFVVWVDLLKRNVD